MLCKPATIRSITLYYYFSTISFCDYSLEWNIF